MTASTSEIVTLDDAIAWTNNTAGTAKNSVISVESAMADLRSQGVGEAALSGLGRMQELFNMIAAEAAAVNAEFRSHTGVKEAYLAAQDAGTKEHLLGG